MMTSPVTTSRVAVCDTLIWFSCLSLFSATSWSLVDSSSSSSSPSKTHRSGADVIDVASSSSATSYRHTEDDHKITASSADFRYLAELAGYSCSSSVNECVFDVEAHQGSSSNDDSSEHDDDVDDDDDALDEPHKRPCFIAGHVEITHNWHGYIGIFRLRSSPSSSSSPQDVSVPSDPLSDAEGSSVNSAGPLGPHGEDTDPVQLHHRPPRIYYRFAYPITDGRCCRSISAVLYSEDQFDKLRARMNCVQRLAVVLDPASTLATVSAEQQHQHLSNHQQIISLGENAPPTSGCSNATATSGSKPYVVCEGGRDFRSDADRSWYIAVSNCGSPSGIVVDYALLVYGLVGDCPTGSGNSTNDRRMMSNDGRQFPASASRIVTSNMSLLALLASFACNILK